MLLLSLLLLILSNITISIDIPSHCNSEYHNVDSVSASTIKAQALLERFPTNVPIKDRLLVMILFSDGFTGAKMSKNRLDWLKCALLKLQKNMLQNTPADVFIWTQNTSTIIPIVPSWLTANNFPRVNVIGIEPETWRIPCGLIHDSKWAVRKHFDIDYYLMGRWRLTFSLDFAKSMGYQYHLQFDDDAMLNAKLEYNIVDKFREQNHFMGVFSDLIGEVPQCTLGLPELTKYWLAVNKQNNPKGALFKHLRPPSLAGLTSEGWDRMYHPGYFIIINTDFWFQSEVQDYLTTVFRSGRDVEGRWQEQAVINMIRLVFVPEKQLWIMQEVDIGHDRHRHGNFDKWCVQTGLITN